MSFVTIFTRTVSALAVVWGAQAAVHSVQPAVDFLETQAPVSKSTLGSTDIYTDNTNALMASAPLTWETLKQMNMDPFLGSARHRQLQEPASGEEQRSFAKVDVSFKEHSPKTQAILVEQDTERPKHKWHAHKTTLTKASEDALRSFSKRKSSVLAAADSEFVQGATTSLDEVGYQAVAARHDSHEMWFFIRRVVEANGAEVANEGMFNGLVPYYSGERDVQTFDRLKEELFQTGVQKGMIAARQQSRSDSLVSTEMDLEEVYQRTHTQS